MKKLSLVLLLGLFSCENKLDGNTYLVTSVEINDKNMYRKYTVHLANIRTRITIFQTDSLYQAGTVIKIGK